MRKCAESGGAALPADQDCNSSCCPIRSSLPLTSSGQPCPWGGSRSQRWTSSTVSRPRMPILWIAPPRCRREVMVPCTLPVCPRSRAVISPSPVRSSCRSISTRSGATNQRPFKAKEPSPCAERSVRAGLPEQDTLPTSAARGRRRNIQIRLGEVEDRFCVAELEMDAAVTDMDCRRRAHHRRN